MSQATMKKAPAVQLEAPRFENAEPLRIAGLREHFTPETMKNIPELWRRFGPHIGNIPGQVGRAAYGLCFKALSPDGVDYLVGVEVSNSSDLPGDFSFANIPAQKYAVFHTVNMFRRCIKLWMPSTSGSRDPASRSPVKPLRRRIFSSATPRNLIRGLEWAVWKFGFQSRLEACQQVLLQFHSGESMYKVYREN
jgi:hypothetical protein